MTLFGGERHFSAQIYGGVRLRSSDPSLFKFQESGNLTETKRFILGQSHTTLFKVNFLPIRAHPTQTPRKEGHLQLTLYSTYGRTNYLQR